MILALRSSVRKFISQRKELPAENCGLATKNKKKKKVVKENSSGLVSTQEKRKKKKVLKFIFIALMLGHVNMVFTSPLSFKHLALIFGFNWGRKNALWQRDLCVWMYVCKCVCAPFRVSLFKTALTKIHSIYHTR